MSVILNERDYAESAIRHHELGGNPVDTLKCVSRLYSADGYKKKEIKSKLEEFLLRCNSDVDLDNWEETIEFFSKTAKKYPLVEIDSVPITKKELDTCLSLDKQYLQRLLFTLICLAKFNYCAYGKMDGWVNLKHSEIFRMANIITSREDQGRLLRALRDAGLIRFSKKVTSLSVAVECMDLDGEPVLEITDYRNLGHQLQGYQGVPVVVCEECGLTILKKGRVHKYCRACAIEVNRRNTYDSYYN